MGRKRDPRRDEAKQLWLDSNGEKKLKDIADELGVSAPQVRKWKSQDVWSKGNVTKKIKERYQNQKHNTNSVGNSGGAPPGNRNGIGNKGGGAPNGNKNALVTGEYETISFEFLSERERELFEGVTDDPLITINTQIRDLKIRQYRIMGRIQEREDDFDEADKDILYQLRKQGKVTTDSKGNTVRVPGMVKVEQTKHKYRKFDDILKLEDALTSVNNTLLRATHEKQQIRKAEADADIAEAKAKQINNSDEAVRIVFNDNLKPDKEDNQDNGNQS
ncbi:phage terminase small subunit [Lactiplantibacillus plantarum]|uniref:phage terminase small subunit n=1 Tax=Lactiplantibacillus plantarum TaxID=1590 RepID=UPI003C25D580